MSLQEKLEKLEAEKQDLLKKHEEEKKQLLQGYIKAQEAALSRVINKKKAFDLTADEVAGAILHLIELKEKSTKNDQQAKSFLENIVGLGENFRGAKRPQKVTTENKEAA